MEIFYFAAGICTSLFTIAIIGLFIAWRKLRFLEKETKSIWNNISQLANDTNKVSDNINNRIDKELESLRPEKKSSF